MSFAETGAERSAEVLGFAMPAEETFRLPEYVEVLMLVERLHRELIDLVKGALEAAGRTDPTPVQALMLFHLAGREMTASELGSRGLYQGSNVSYNLKKLVDGGFVEYRRCTVDGRAVRLRLSEDGEEVHALLEDLFRQHAWAFARLARESAFEPRMISSALRLMRQSRLSPQDAIHA
ncbi:MAG: MarR family transcriptional regulator [Pseudomonadota bacterium]